jgi:hypothetical protein
MVSKLDGISESIVESKYAQPGVQNQCNEAGNIISDTLNILTGASRIVEYILS